MGRTATNIVGNSIASWVVAKLNFALTLNYQTANVKAGFKCRGAGSLEMSDFGYIQMSGLAVRWFSWFSIDAA